MAKTLRGMVMEAVSEREKASPARGKNMILAYWGEIKDLLSEGHNLALIHEVLKSRMGLTVGYGTFRYHVRTLQSRDRGTADEKGNSDIKDEIKCKKIEEQNVVIVDDESKTGPVIHTFGDSPSRRGEIKF